MVAGSSPSDGRTSRRGPAATLRSRGDFARIQADGRTRGDRLLSVRFVPNTLGQDRYGISTGRRLGSSVRRNRVRRRIREIMRQADAPVGWGWDILVIARPACSAATFPEMRASLLRLVGSVHALAVTAAP